MERNESAVACAMRVKAYGLLQELLAFQVSPAACLDEAGNRSLHYAAYYRDLAALEIVLQRCGDQWWHAVLSKNRAGETPLALAEAAGAARLGLGLRLGLRLGLGLANLNPNPNPNPNPNQVTTGPTGAAPTGPTAARRRGAYATLPLTLTYPNQALAYP